MKRLAMMIIGACLLAAACGINSAGSLGKAPTGAPSPAVSASPPGATPTATAQPPGGQPPATPIATPTQSHVREIGLQAWFTRNGKLFVTARTVQATRGVGQAAIDSVLAGPSAAESSAGLSSQIPAGTTLLGVSISSGTATVDLSSSFTSAAGPSTMPLRIAQVVYTLTQFPTVTGVRFAINGQGVTVIGGVPVQAPQTRTMYASYLPAITVQAPFIGEQVTSPVTVSGAADVFEAVVSVRVLDSAGNEITRTFTNATCGTGCRGDYSVTISYTVPRTEPGTIEVFERSAKTGLPINVQLIPVTLAA